MDFVREKPMSNEDKMYGSRARKKWVWFSVLHMLGEIIMPFWQIVFYWLLNSTVTRSAFAVFEKSTNGFVLINPSRLFKTVMILGVVDTIFAVLFTCVVRCKFPLFTPFMMLNIVIKKYNLLLCLSVMTVVLTVVCLIIIDCRFDFSIAGIKAAFGI